MTERLEARFGDARIEFPTYPYAPASVFPAGPVDAHEVRDADPRAAPPEIRLRTGETLFVRGDQHDELRQFCERNGIPLLRRSDVWDALLQPFVDTELYWWAMRLADRSATR